MLLKQNNISWLVHPTGIGSENLSLASIVSCKFLEDGACDAGVVVRCRVMVSWFWCALRFCFDILATRWLNFCISWSVCCYCTGHNLRVYVVEISYWYTISVFYFVRYLSFWLWFIPVHLFHGNQCIDMWLIHVQCQD